MLYETTVFTITVNCGLAQKNILSITIFNILIYSRKRQEQQSKELNIYRWSLTMEGKRINIGK
jgi:hypothetical protein